MRKQNILKIICFLSLASLLLPWLSQNPKMCGYVWGWSYAMYFALPLILSGAFVFNENRGPAIKLLGILGAAANPLMPHGCREL